jgi:hypothetical protein
VRLIKTLPRYRCDHCRHTATREAMERHERICWKNPDRFCDLCQNKGSYGDVDGLPVIPCYWCSQRKTEWPFQKSA